MKEKPGFSSLRMPQWDLQLTVIYKQSSTGPIGLLPIRAKPYRSLADSDLPCSIGREREIATNQHAGSIATATPRDLDPMVPETPVHGGFNI